MLSPLLARWSLVALTSVVIAQDPSWLRPVASLSLPLEITTAADISPEGSVIAVLTKERTLRVYSRSPLRELRRFVVPEKLGAANVRITADSSTAVVFDPDGKPTIAMRLADGARVEPVPEVTAPLTDLPKAVRDEMPATGGRTTRDASAATFEAGYLFWLWSEGAFHTLDAMITDARLTGDGKYVLVRRMNGVTVLAAAGGGPWHVPELGVEPVVVPIGAESMFVAADREGLVFGDAAGRRVVRRMPFADFKDAIGRPTLLAASPDGNRLALAAVSPARKAEGWFLDVEHKQASAQPFSPLLAEWVHDGFVLLGGRPGPCSSLAFARWNWWPSVGAASGWDAMVFSMPLARIAPLPARREFIQACANQFGEEERLARVSASDGRVLARQPISKPRESDNYDVHLFTSPTVVAGYLIDTCYVDSTAQLELRQLEDLSLIATAREPAGGFAGFPNVTAAEHAPRLLFWFDDKFAVYDFVPPAPAEK